MLRESLWSLKKNVSKAMLAAVRLYCSLLRKTEMEVVVKLRYKLAIWCCQRKCNLYVKGLCIKVSRKMCDSIRLCEDGAGICEIL